MGQVENSSLVKQVGFSAGPGERGTLRITFHDAVIDFRNVSYAIYKGLVTARDHSAYYHRYVHGKYEYEKQ